MIDPRISVISVVRNDSDGLQRTIASISKQNYTNYEYIVVDGNSTDLTGKVIKGNSKAIDKVINDSGLGVYNAMNLGADIATGDWLIFMNAGDCFVDNDILSHIAGYLTGDIDVLYSDWIYLENNKRVIASHAQMNVRHQSVVYKKSLHNLYGSYVVGKNVTISDFIFFQSISKLKWVYTPRPISICEQSGLSADPSHFYQRILIEGVFKKRSRMMVAAILVLYPIYRFAKRNILRNR